MTGDLFNPIQKPWVDIECPRNTPVDIQLANGGAYVGFFVGGANEKDVTLTLVGVSGNTTTTQVVGISNLTVDDGTGTGIITLTYTGGNSVRHFYIMPMNEARPAYVSE